MFMDRAKQCANEEEWLEERQKDKRITGSAVAGILGKSPYSSPWKVFNEKYLGHVEEVDETRKKIFSRGHKWEPRVLEDYAEETGRKVRRFNHLLVCDASEDWLWASPDGVVKDPELGVGGIEAKTSAKPWLWGESGAVLESMDDYTEELFPVEYAIQCYVYLRVTGLPFWDLAVLTPSKYAFVELKWFRIMRDEAAQNALVDKVKKWREDHLIQGISPEIDGTDSCTQGLAETFRSDSKKEKDGTEDQIALAARFVEVKGEIETLEKEHSKLKNELIAEIGEDKSIKTGRSSRITLIRYKNRNTVSLRAYGYENDT